MATPQYLWSPQQQRPTFQCQLWAAPLQSLHLPTITTTTHRRAGQIFTLTILWIMFLLWGPHFLLLHNKGSDAGTMMVMNLDNFSAVKLCIFLAVLIGFPFLLLEKGLCMRGDMCPFDHGSDPVVVEDVNLPNMLSFQPPQIPGVEPPPPPGLPPPPPLMNAPPVNLRPPVPPPCALPPSLPPVAGRNSDIFLGIWFCVLEWLMIKGKGKKMTPSCLLLLLKLVS